MSEMIEKLARIVYAAMLRVEGEDSPTYDDCLKYGGNIHFHEANRAARAAIEALREPSEAMIEAPGWSNLEVWQAMIDAALSPDTGER